jgi:hypothetical protein
MDQNEEQPRPLAVDEEPETVLDHKQALQQVIVDLLDRATGAERGQVLDQLVVAVAEAGLPEQPVTWVRGVVDELCAGRVTVLDARFEIPQRPAP